MSDTAQDDFALTSQRSFFAVLLALRHLYFKLEHEGMDLHSNCELCEEISNFLSVPFLAAPDYPIDDFDSAFLTAQDALKHLYTKLEADFVKLDTPTCHDCVEAAKFVFTPDYRGNVGNTLIYCDACERPQPLIIDPMTRDANDHRVRGDLLCGVCRYVITTLTVREEGEYEFVKVETLPDVQ